MEGVTNDPKLLYNIALSYDMANNKTEAEKYYLKAIEKGKLTKAMNNLAILYYEQKKLQEALKYYKTLVDNYGMNENAYNKKIKVELMELKNKKRKIILV